MTQAVMDQRSAPGPSIPWPSARVAWWAVIVFALSLMVNFLDRGILTLLVGPIKQDLHLSDFQMSLIMGLAFIFFYMVAGLPIARAVDSISRRRIIGIGLTLWSLMTAACGLATSFPTLFAARVGVGVGEACTGPATYSMLADFFPPEKLPRAIGVLNMGFVLGSSCALLIGGTVITLLSATPIVHLPIIGDVKSWQATMMAVGLPGLLIALLMLTVPEPVRRGDTGATPPIRDVVAYLVKYRGAYGLMTLGMVVNTVLFIGAGAWTPTFYMRHWGWTPGQVGTVMAALIIATQPAGAFCGVRMAEWLAKRGYDDANMRVTFFAALALVPFSVLFPFAPSAQVAVGLAAFSGFVGAWTFGPQNAAFQVITPNRMRGQITALFLFAFNVVGVGVGPTAVAFLTTYVFKSEAKLGLSLATAAAVLGPIGAIFLGLSLKPYAARIAELRAEVGAAQ
jgi:MFS family permease